MKKRLLSFLAIAASTLSFGQLQQGRYAPDFTITDLDGTEHNLYTYLDEGKTVVIDLFATWCGPCWTYHQTHVLEDLHTTHGPDGDNSMVVIAIESSTSTTLADVLGTGSNTYGDWTDGISYPMVHDEQGSVAQAYALGYYPTVYIIDPERTVYEIGQSSSVSTFADWEGPKAADQAADNLRWLDNSKSTKALCGSYTQELMFQNYGSNTITSATLTVSNLDGTLDVVNWTGNLEPFEEGAFEFSTDALSGNEYLKVTVTDVNGNTDGDASNDVTNWQVAADADHGMYEENVTIKVTSDGYESEFGWLLRNAAGTVISGGQNYSNSTDGNVFLEETIAVTPGCYKLEILDTYGDGLSYGSNGKFEMLNSAGTVIFEEVDFGSYAGMDFNIWDPNSVEGVDALNLAVYPNPTSGSVNITTTYEEAVNVTVYNALGELVKEVANVKMNGNYILDLSDLNTGAYFINIANDNVNTSKRITLMK
ncbi:redoxin domain-containing protein [Flavobacteriales bacterium]|nr:redoxin domain-containing protein [Flavobacteriales bacterium]